ncbi:MAG: cation:proton antiporter, partial [Elusimicrobiota bacterium]
MMTEALDTSLLAALMLLVAIVGGYIAKWVRAPRIVAYIVGGILLRHYLGRVATAEHLGVIVESLSFVNELALGLILFMLGAVFEASRLKQTRGAMRRFSLTEIGLTAFLTFAGCFLAAWTLPDMTLSRCLAVGLILGMIAVETAPAATWFVLREYDAKGPTTDHLLVMTGINDIASIVGFHVVLVFCVGFGFIDNFSARQGAWWIELFMVTVGSAGIGMLLGVLLSIAHSRLPLREMILMFFATLFLLSAGDNAMRHIAGTAFNPMITTLVMGIVFVNIARDPGFFEQTLETVSLPIFALFFVLAGYSLHLEELSHLGVLGIVYIAARSAGKILGVRRMAQRHGEDTKLRENTGLGLLCHAGVAVFLGSYLVRHWSDPLAQQINTVILASVALYELVGPFLVKHVAITAGEVKTVTLLRPGFFK